MKKIIAVLLLAVLALSISACGSKTSVDLSSESQVESTADVPVTEHPEVGRIGERSTFYVYIPEHWCKMEYTGDDTRLRLFDIPSAPKIEEGKTPEVEIRVAADAGKKEDVDAAVAELLKIEGAKKSKGTKLDGESFSVVKYTNAKEKRDYTAYVGLGGGSLATITLKGVAPSDEDAAAILRSISFKSMDARKMTTTTTKAATTAAKTTKASNDKADSTTVDAEKATTAKAAAATTAAAKATTKANETTAAAKATSKAAETTAAAKATSKAAETTAAAKATTKTDATTAAAKTTAKAAD